MIDSVLRRSRHWTRTFLLPGLLMLGGCATTADNPDPLEDVNRHIFQFNEFVDRNLLEPVARAYTTVAPAPLQTGVANFYTNLRYPLVAINQFLQGKVNRGLQDSGRFLVNTTMGIGGLFDPASQMGLPVHEEDFGQTLARWGLDSGPFLMVPLVGPHTLRDGAGRLLHSNVTYLPQYVDEIPVRNTLIGLDFINTRAQLLDRPELFAGGDRYLFLRGAYLQRRDFLISDGE